jgi:uroporphyrinogen-III decarboxylase
MPPYDVLQNFLRGMRGTILDIYKHPEKIVEACHKILPWVIDTGVTAAKMTGNPRVLVPIHWGSEGFMSNKQFEALFFPTLKLLIEALVYQGLTPIAFFEGSYTTRLDYLLELPKGKIIGQFDSTDIFKAKDVLKNHMSIKGNVPLSLLQTGSPQEIIDHCKKLIDVVGKDGGFIIDTRAPLDIADPAKVKIMLDFVREYGVYR